MRECCTPPVSRFKLNPKGFVPLLVLSPVGVAFIIDFHCFGGMKALCVYTHKIMTTLLLAYCIKLLKQCFKWIHKLCWYVDRLINSIYKEKQLFRKCPTKWELPKFVILKWKLITLTVRSIIYSHGIFGKCNLIPGYTGLGLSCPQELTWLESECHTQ